MVTPDAALSRSAQEHMSVPSYHLSATCTSFRFRLTKEKSFGSALLIASTATPFVATVDVVPVHLPDRPCPVYVFVFS